ncbi:MAG: hypothetical protein B7733_02550 [Myxococcales bacterium FL481]|nr:MAG: hypothetical protein B7733_02550 [Myxococcales bacterium FL481]
MNHALLTLFATTSCGLALAGCTPLVAAGEDTPAVEGSTGDAPDDGATGAWWDVESVAPDDGGDDIDPEWDDGDDDDDDDDDEDEDEDAVFWFGEGQVVPGERLEMHVEFVAYIDGEDRCLLFMQARDAAPDETCEACDWAFSFTLGDVEIEAEEHCDEYDIDPSALDGASMAVGYADETGYRRLDGEWAAVGWAEYNPDESFFEWEQEL